MDKKVKWGIVILVGAGLIGWGIYSRLPKANEELAAADKVMTGKQINKRVLNVNAKIIKPQLLTDQIQISGSLMPDEEVDLSFETSGKIVEINFDEGTTVKKGQLLAKVNDRQLQAQLQRLVAQLKLAEDRVFRQNALLERDAVSKEAYEQVKTELATLNADIDFFIIERILKNGILHILGKSEYCHDRTSRTLRRGDRTPAGQRWLLCFTYYHRSQTDKNHSSENRVFRTRALCQSGKKGN